jgi:uncharacterized membrane protein YeaQ/YmgE (transglycosylase-associated protein family)
MFGIVGWILFGLVVGAIAKLIMPGKDPGGIIVTMLLGIVGAVVGGFIGRSLGFYGPQQTAGWLMSVQKDPPYCVYIALSRLTSAADTPATVAMSLLERSCLRYRSKYSTMSPPKPKKYMMSRKSLVCVRPSAWPSSWTHVR